VSACSGRFSVDGIVDSNAGPVRNPVNRTPHRVKVAIQDGFEFTEAEFGSSTTTASGSIPLDWSDRHAHLAMIDIGPSGPSRKAA
jgi:hypothetical protein